MKKILLSLLCVLACIGAYAQNCTYTTSFELSDDNGSWLAFSNRAYNKLVINTDANAVTDGEQALYVTVDGSTYGYNPDCGAACASVFCRSFFFEGGVQYTVTFKYRSNGEEDTDYGNLFIASTSREAIEGAVSGASFPSTWDRGEKSALSLPLDAQENFTTITKTFTPTTNGNYYVIFWWGNDESDGEASTPLAVDEFSLSSDNCTKGFDYVVPAGDPSKYICGFEPADDVSPWRFVNNESAHYWTIGSDNTTDWWGIAGVKDGQRALYISTDGSTYGYFKEEPVTGNTQKIAYLPFNVEAGVSYSISFDWMLNGAGFGGEGWEVFSSELGYVFILDKEPTVGFVNDYGILQGTTGQFVSTDGTIATIPSSEFWAPSAYVGQPDWKNTAGTYTATADKTVYLTFAYLNQWGTEKIDGNPYWPFAVDNVSIVAGDGWQKGLGLLESCSDNYIEQSATICKGESYEFGNNHYKEGGVYEYSVQNSEGCNDHYTLTLNVIDCDALASAPYYTSFEEEEAAEASKWMFYSQAGENKFAIGKAAGAACGQKALYITNGTQYAYTTDEMDIAIAAREFNLKGGQTYTVSFDYKCNAGDDAGLLQYGLFEDGLEAAIEDGSFFSNSVPISDDYLTGNADWTSASYTFTPDVDGFYTLMFMWINEGEEGDDNQPLAIDNFSVTLDGVTPDCQYNFTAATLPYQTGFEQENADDNAQWRFIKATGANYLVIGNDAQAVKDGEGALYVTKDGTTYSYDENEYSEGYAFRTITFAAGTYLASFDWKCVGQGGYTAYDYATIYVASADESVVSADPIAVLVREAVDKDEWKSVLKEFTIETAGDYNFIIKWSNCGWADATTLPFAIDNIKIEAGEIEKIAATDVPYIYGFEDEAENANWTLITSAPSNYFIIGTDAARKGEKSLYLTTDGTYNTYNILESGTEAIAYRPLNLQAGVTYTVSFDYRVEGASISFDEVTYYGQDFGQIAIMKGGSDGPIEIEDVRLYDLEKASAQLFNHPGWGRGNGSFSVDEDGVYSIALTWKSLNGTEPSKPIAYDNIAIREASFNDLYSTGYEATDDNDTWELFKGLATEDYVDYHDSKNHFIIGTDANAVKDGEQALYISNNDADYAYSTDVSNSLAVRAFDLVAGASYKVEFDYKVNGAGSVWGPSDYAYVALFGQGSVDELLVYADEVWGWKEGYYMAYESTSDDYLSDAPEYQHYSWDIVPEETKTYMLGIVWFNSDESTVANFPIAIDNFKLSGVVPCGPFEQTEEATIKETQTYSFCGDQLNEAGVYTCEDEDENGCLVIVTLTLTVEPCQTTTKEINETITKGESYTICGNEYTEEGTYHCESTDEEGCPVEITLNLTVVSAVDNVSILPLVVAPNPVRAGSTTYVNREWSEAERNGMKVVVVSSTGQVVESYSPATYPVEISGLNNAGIYYVRIIAGTGDVYTGKLIVK